MAERSLPMFPDEGDDTVYGYMCKVDFECELGYSVHKCHPIVKGYLSP